MKDLQSRLESPSAFAIIVTAVLALGLVLWRWIVLVYPKLEDRASFGNLFGGINTLFAGLAFAALIFTLILQQRALGLQRSELAEQRKELLDQNRRIEMQAFEEMLVQLLRFHHDITKDVSVSRPNHNRDFVGRHALRVLADELRGIVANASREGKHRYATGVAQAAYEQFHDWSRGTLDHYFRNLYHIIEFIDGSNVPDKRRYTSLVRAQLSPAELILLFYNGLSPYGDKFKPLIEKYALLEQLPPQEFAAPGHKSLYTPGAYG